MKHNAKILLTASRMGLIRSLEQEAHISQEVKIKELLLQGQSLKDAPIIVLDEATAFADAENEHQIQLAF